jgi:hypothetical protein
METFAMDVARLYLEFPAALLWPLRIDPADKQTGAASVSASTPLHWLSYYVRRQDVGSGARLIDRLTGKWRITPRGRPANRALQKPWYCLRVPDGFSEAPTRFKRRWRDDSDIPGTASSEPE